MNIFFFSQISSRRGFAAEAKNRETERKFQVPGNYDLYSLSRKIEI